MKKFSFSMEKILDIRTFEKKQAESELSMAMMKEREIQAQIDSLTEKRALCVIDAEKSTDFSVIVNSQKYLKFIEKKTEELSLELAQAQIVSEEKRGALQECIKKEKALEKLKEKKYEEWKKEIKKEEQKEMDEILNVLIRH